VEAMSRSGATSSTPLLSIAACITRNLHPATNTYRGPGGVGCRMLGGHLRQPDGLTTACGGDSWLCGPASRRVCSCRVTLALRFATSQSDYRASTDVSCHSVDVEALTISRLTRATCCTTAVCRSARTSRRCCIPER
jgi:hypothetical protein